MHDAVAVALELARASGGASATWRPRELASLTA
jgi:hypothetical protein